MPIKVGGQRTSRWAGARHGEASQRPALLSLVPPGGRYWSRYMLMRAAVSQGAWRALAHTPAVVAVLSTTGLRSTCARGVGGPGVSRSASFKDRMAARHAPLFSKGMRQTPEG